MIPDNPVNKPYYVIELLFTAALVFVSGVVLCGCSDCDRLCHVVLFHASVTKRHDLRANNHHGRGKLHDVSDVTGHGSGHHR